MQDKRSNGVGLVRVDPEKLRYWMRNLNLNVQQFSETTELARNTVYKLLDGKPVTPKVIQKIETRIGVSRDELIVDEQENEELAYRLPCPPEWRVVPGSLGRMHSTSNGLFCRDCKLEHRHVVGRVAHGKIYDLHGIPHAERLELIDKLNRHPQVCERTKESPFIAVNLSSTPTSANEGWWVIDHWYGEFRLRDKINDSPLQRDELRTIFEELLIGLVSLHAAKVIVRELAPERVVLRDGHPIVTDLELAKLLDRTETVSSKWKPDDYLAPEVFSGHFGSQADLFSWAKMFVHAAFADPTATGDREVAPAENEVPTRVSHTIKGCLSLMPSNRPKSAAVVLKAFQTWI